MKYRKKPVVIEAITFEEFIEYGKNNSKNIVNGMPWSFNYNGYPVTHENDERYLIPTLEGVHNFTPQDMLITGINGEIYPCKLDIFHKTYEKVEMMSDRTLEKDVVDDVKEDLTDWIVNNFKEAIDNDDFNNILIAYGEENEWDGDELDCMMDDLVDIIKEGVLNVVDTYEYRKEG